MWLVSTASSLRFVHVLTMLDVNCILDAMHVQRWDSCRLCNFMVKVWRIRVELIVFGKELNAFQSEFQLVRRLQCAVEPSLRHYESL